LLYTQELKNNEAWYRQFAPDTVAGELLEADWRTIFHEPGGYLDCAKPTRGKTVTSDRYLEAIHILGFANVLKRPILLLDSLQAIREDRVTSPYGMLVFPLRFSRQEVLREHSGRIPSPLCIAWQSDLHNHYVSLWPYESREQGLLSTHTLRTHLEELQGDRDLRIIVLNVKSLISLFTGNMICNFLRRLGLQSSSIIFSTDLIAYPFLPLHLALVLAENAPHIVLSWTTFMIDLLDKVLITGIGEEIEIITLYQRANVFRVKHSSSVLAELGFAICSRFVLLFRISCG